MEHSTRASVKKIKKESSEQTLVRECLKHSDEKPEFNVKEAIYNDIYSGSKKTSKSMMQILRENNDPETLKREIDLLNNFNFPKEVRVSSNILEMHPQILKDKLRISKVIHKHFDPSLYERENIKAIKQIMKLDRSETLDNPESLYKPYAKEEKGIRALLEKRRKIKKRNTNKSFDSKRDLPLGKVILNDFKTLLDKDDNLENNRSYLDRKNKVVDIMDDYYSRHIHKGLHKPEHLFMFKAKPMIPPGRILLEIERRKDRTKDRGPKIKVGESEVSLLSPIKGGRDQFTFEDFNGSHILPNDPSKDTGEFKVIKMRNNSVSFIKTRPKKSNEDITEVMNKSPKISHLQKSMEVLKNPDNEKDHSPKKIIDSEYIPKLPNIKRKIKYQTPKKKRPERAVKLNSINTSSINPKLPPKIQIPLPKPPHCSSKSKTELNLQNPQLQLCKKLSDLAKNNKKFTNKSYSKKMDSISTSIDKLKGAIETYEEHLNANVFNKNITLEEIKEDNELARVRNIDNFLNPRSIHKFKNENFLNSLYLSHMQSKSLWKPDKFKLADRLIYNIQQNQ
ncbi:unnamed protein product [Moneuplotes crassus]|uniref:Uncharacterized protein n=1 Tax=Euplotes crassus TaxID=5936 RepID=A0AAD1X9N7_EUPCR|nr:unnamed protein product [Moneuplotes crassus]